MKQSTHEEEKAEIAAASAAIDQRKAATSTVKFYRQLREEATAKPKPAKPKSGKRKKGEYGPKADIMRRGRRLPGSGWAGTGQR